MPFKDPEARRAYAAEYRKRNPVPSEVGSSVRKQYNSRRPKRTVSQTHRFVGVDGEGYTDAFGRHHYITLTVGKSTLFTGKPLTTAECLTFLANQPVNKTTVYVGFFFDYDATMILRDITSGRPDKASELVNVKPRTELEKAIWEPRKFGSYVKWRQFGIDYVPRKHLSVRRVSGREETGKLLWSPAVVVHDVRAFFQMSFVKALDTFSIGTPEQRALIAGMKAERGSFDLTQATSIIQYSEMECELLADMVSLLRDRFMEVGLSPYPYEGPGPVAGAVLKQHVTGKERMEAMRSAIPDDVWDMAVKAYYGGRFEVAAHGTIGARVWEYDIKSAYPDAMTKLPCLIHGKWVPGIQSDLWIGEISWQMPDQFGTGSMLEHAESLAGVMGPLPFRTPEKRIHFPMAGRGWYWSPEIPSYATVHSAYSYLKRCDCQPFSFVKEMYSERASLEQKRKGSGIALKLTLNSLYGKLAQRIGSAPHFNPVWAGLITAMTRAKIYDVYKAHPSKVVMFATDAVFLTEEAPELDLGSNLGQWELEGPFDDLTIFQPGVYFNGETALFKTRGVPKQQFQRQIPDFIRASNDFRINVPLQMSNHLGMRLCLSRGDAWYDRSGDWITQERIMNADPSHKRLVLPGGLYEKGRVESGLIVRDGTKWSLPRSGGTDQLTTTYDPNDPEEAFFGSLEWDEGSYDGE